MRVQGDTADGVEGREGPIRRVEAGVVSAPSRLADRPTRATRTPARPVPPTSAA